MPLQDLPRIEFAPSDKDLRAKRHVFNFLRKSSRYRESYESDWEKVLAEYLNTRLVKQNILQRANLKIPYAFTVVESFVPQITEAFLGDRPYIQAVGRGVEDEPFGEALSEHLSYQLDQTDFFSKFVVFVKNLLIFGSSVAKVVWSYKERNSGALDAETLFDGPEIMNIELQDFFPDWGSTIPGNIESMRGCVHRVWRTMEELRLRERRVINGKEIGIYKNIDELDRSLRSRGDRAWTNMSQPADDRLSIAKDRYFNLESGAKTNDKVEIWEYWGLFDLDDNDTLKECVITVANGDVVLRVAENPYDTKRKPFLMAVDHPIAGELYGVGEILPVLSLIKEGTALRNARLDQTNQAVNRMWLVDRNSGINVRNLYTRPGGIILANDINGIKPLDAPESAPATFKEMAQIDYDIQNATAQVNASQSVSNVGRAFGRTATGVSFMQSATANRLSLKVRLVEDMFFRQLGKAMLELNKQFMQNDVWVRMYNSDSPFSSLPADAFAKSYDFYAVGAMDRLNKSQRQQILQQVLIPYLQVVEQSHPNTVKWDNLTRRLFKEFDWQNLNELITTPEERQQAMDQMMESQKKQAEEAMNMEMMKEQRRIEQDKSAKIEQDNHKALNKMGVETVKGMVSGAKSRPAKL